MKIKRILKAAFKIRNFALLAAVLIISYITDYLPLALIGSAGYIYFVLQTLKSSEFQKEYSAIDKLDNIKNLNSECRELFYNTHKRVSSLAQSKMADVLREKEEILEFFYKDSNDNLKQKIVEQALNLVIAYIRLISSYSIRSKEAEVVDVGEIVSRININNRKLEFMKDHLAIEDLKKAIEMDEKILERLKSERVELERVSAKLEYMESTIEMFKHQIISSENTDEVLADIENAVNEATALDNVLSSDRKDRLSS